ncbi:MAG: hypothetical protein ACK4K0_01095 [Flavobacteriales bacterium]
MKKIFLALGIITLFSYSGLAQKEFDDLLVLLVSENYEKVRVKSFNLSQKDTYKKDPRPYYYFSMASFRMSRDNKFSDDYPKAYKDAQSYAIKCRKMDKEGSFYKQNEEYFDQLKAVMMEDIENSLMKGTEKDYRNALGELKKMKDIDPNDMGGNLLWGMAEILNKNVYDGKKICQEYIAKITSFTEKGNFGDLSEQTQYNLRYALMKYAEFLSEKDPAAAKSTIALGKKYFYNSNEEYKKEYNKDYKELYDKLHK